MTYEEAYKYAIDVADMFIAEEDGVARNQAEMKRIYALEHPLYSLMTFPYSNLFVTIKRNEYDQIIDNPIRSQQIIRIRLKCLTIISLTGKEFVEKLTNNIIDAICLNSGEAKPRTLRRELEVYFRQRPIMWFCILASSVYNNKLVANSAALKSKQISLGTAPMTRKAV